MAKRPRFIVPLLVVAGFVAAGIYVDRQRTAYRSTLSGVFESQPTMVSTRTGGRVDQILVKEGQTVKKSDELATLEAGPSVDQARALQATSEQAALKADEVERGPRVEEIQRQRAVVAEAQSLLDKVVRGPRPEEVAAAQAQLRQAEAKLKLAVEGPRKEEVQRAVAAERQAYSALQAAKRGPTVEERAQVRARLDAASASADVAQNDAERKRKLYESGAVSKAEFEHYQAAAATALAAKREAASAYERAMKGTPAEELAQAEQAYAGALAGRREAERGSRPEEISAATEQARAARESYEMLRRGSRQEDVAAARARLNQARALLVELERGNRKEVVGQALSGKQAAEFQARSAQANAAENVVRAPIDGIVERIPISVGNLLAPGAPILQMGDPTDIWLRVYVPEKALAQIKIDDDVDIEADGVDETLPGIVESIATTGEFTPANIQTPEERGKQVFAVRIRLKNKDSRIKAGMSATVRRIGGYKP